MHCTISNLCHHREGILTISQHTADFFLLQLKLDCNFVISVSSGQAARDREHVNPQNTSVLIKKPADLIQRDLSSLTMISPRCKQAAVIQPAAF